MVLPGVSPINFSSRMVYVHHRNHNNTKSPLQMLNPDGSMRIRTARSSNGLQLSLVCIHHRLYITLGLSSKVYKYFGSFHFLLHGMHIYIGSCKLHSEKFTRPHHLLHLGSIAGDPRWPADYDLASCFRPTLKTASSMVYNNCPKIKFPQPISFLTQCQAICSNGVLFRHLSVSMAPFVYIHSVTEAGRTLWLRSKTFR